MKKTYQAILFDLDGVLCHTDRFHFLGWKKIADQLGIPFDEEKNNRLRGVSRMESLEIILEDYPLPLSQQEKNDLAAQKNTYYRELLGEMTPADIEPVVLETLEALQQKGVRMAIGSSSKNAGYILEQTDLTKWFSVVIDGNAITQSKPHPEVFLNGAEAFGLAPADCLVVEDADAGVEAAHAGGMDCAAIGDAAKSEKAEYRLNTLADLLLLF